eukprot:gene15289-biopygen4535
MKANQGSRSILLGFDSDNKPIVSGIPSLPGNSPCNVNTSGKNCIRNSEPDIFQGGPRVFPFLTLQPVSAPILSASRLRSFRPSVTGMGRVGLDPLAPHIPPHHSASSECAPDQHIAAAAPEHGAQRPGHARHNWVVDGNLLLDGGRGTTVGWGTGQGGLTRRRHPRRRHSSLTRCADHHIARCSGPVLATQHPTLGVHNRIKSSRSCTPPCARVLHPSRDAIRARRDLDDKGWQPKHGIERSGGYPRDEEGRNRIPRRQEELPLDQTSVPGVDNDGIVNVARKTKDGIRRIRRLKTGIRCSKRLGISGKVGLGFQSELNIRWLDCMTYDGVVTVQEGVMVGKGQHIRPRRGRGAQGWRSGIPQRNPPPC